MTYYWGGTIICFSQEEERCQDLAGDHISLDRLTDQLCHFVGALESCGDFHCSSPVVVIEALLVGKLCQGFLRNLGGIVHHNVVSRGAGAFGHFLGSQMEIVELIDWEFVKHDGSWSWIFSLRGKLIGARYTASVREVENSCIDFRVNHCIHYFRSVIFFLCPFSDLLYHRIEGIQFSLHLPLDLLNAQSLPVNHDQLRTSFVQRDVAPRPVDKHSLIFSLRDRFFAFIPGFAIGKHPGEVFVEGACEGQGESFFAFRDRDSSIHGLLLRCISIILRDYLPGCSSYLLIHLDEDFRSCWHGIFGFENCFSPDCLARKFEVTSKKTFEFSIEFFFKLI